MIGAIETVYKGYNFRSRLEARWAVFFDDLSIKWLYEPEGFEAYGYKYLPDFYLPEFKTWVEVKGGDDALKNDLEKLELLLDFSSPLPYVGGSWYAGSTNGLIILGNIPEKTLNLIVHPIIQHDSGLFVEYVCFGYKKVINIDASFNPVSRYYTKLSNSFLDIDTKSVELKPIAQAHTVRAYDKARMARFEHGEKP
jgi:hypothetical protein